ncbi:amino acid adenylation domain-containing protein [Amycolatopsis echigonensis]|uniref:Amino acid adenylation domain-containing protein n=1 Tax=Amycolatopsis echigonensis TaxID=2576905 RepID=A0A8E1VYL3_9PSEU|nr:amino acid adenylation domain-containing protein [Amycolatopsis echigonensis]MBB2500554.1 amino acid adenylation domain-containing protein [Amycolatopsis echigonensis]
METTQLSTRKPVTRLGADLISLLRRQVAEQPDAIAVVSAERSLTRLELHREAASLAAGLRQAGAGPDDRVGLFAEPSADLVSGVWGILGAGAAYLPLSPDYPEERLRYMLSDSGTKTVLAQEHLADRVAAIAPPGTTVLTPRAARDRAAGPAPLPSPHDLAYVIYTSGSTGRPKGVQIEHSGIVSQLRWLHTVGYLDRDTVVLQKTPMSFDAAQWEILATAFGGKVVMGEPGIHRDPHAVIDTVRRHQINTLQGVPTLLQALADTEQLGQCTSLRRVFSGGEALSRQLARQLTGELPAASLINLYGPTECSINATSYLVDPDALGDGPGSIPIGFPVDNTQCYILDENRSPADIGEVGELYVGGAQLARGYLNRPEATAERFVRSPFVPTERLYRTGDLAFWNPDGSIQFAGRTDNQVKLRGYRVELDEIGLAIEEHAWVRRAAVVVTNDERTGFDTLVACIELNPKEAALMDQGNHGAHHQTKSSRLQVKAQLAGAGVREPAELEGKPVVPLPGRAETEHQRSTVFARKTYRNYDRGPVTRAELRDLLEHRPPRGRARGLDELTFAQLGELLRWFGQFHSDERLLPKYAYASPGALYATQLFLDTTGIAGVEPGIHYYHPVDHTLVRIGASPRWPGAGLAVHFVGRKQAIEPVYRNNIGEVLEFEAGHMLGVFEEALAGYGLDIRPLGHDPSIADSLGGAAGDQYLGTFEIRPDDGSPRPDDAELFVQAHPGRVTDLPAGQYRYADGEFTKISEDLVQARHVIAINQRVYDQAAFGITAIGRAEQPWLQYLRLGTKLHHLQRNGLGLGLMSSGYSSKSGHPLPAARRVDEILSAAGEVSGPSYFFVGGRVSAEQIRSEGMAEDVLHMKGPAEIVKDDLARLLPDYMIPQHVLVLDRLPLTANGKVDRTALAASDQVRPARTASPYVAPATETQRVLARLWGETLKYDEVSMADEFFASGGNSLTAVTLVHRINKQFAASLPLQAIFEHPTPASLAERIERGAGDRSSRLIRLGDAGAGRPVFCWPGLGGYPMNLRALAREAAGGRPFYGVQAHGINPGEQPYATIREMAAADVAELRRIQTEGPYLLWGYSFGARVAFEAAWQLEQLGERVEQLLLICPGNPTVPGADPARFGREPSYANPAYVTILFSVFAGKIAGPDLRHCLERARDEDSFVAFVHELRPALDPSTIRRITRIVAQTYEFEYSFHELAQRRLDTHITIFKAAGDDYSFIEGRTGYSAAPPTIVDLACDHYEVLKDPGVAELAAAIAGAGQPAGGR